MVKRLADYPWSSYKAYAYGLIPPKWLTTDLILSQFTGAPDCHRRYREKVQKYASEEKRFFEDLHHGLILGSKQFVEKIRKKYLPTKADSSIPQQKQMAQTFDPEDYLRKAELIFECDVKHFVSAKRLSGVEKETRDILLYGI